MNKHRSFQFVLDGLEASKGKWPKVAKDTGVSKRTIEKIARGEIANPGVRHIETLADYFEANKAV